MILEPSKETFTPVFPGLSKDESENILHKEDKSIININQTNKRIEKKGNYLYIDNISILIEKKTVQEVVQILRDHGVDAKLYSDLYLLPAIMINDFSNLYTSILEPNTNPMDITKIFINEYFKIRSKIKPTLRNIEVFSKDKTIPFSLISNILYYKNNEDIRVFYSLLYTDFDITVTSNTFSVINSSMLYTINNSRED